MPRSYNPFKKRGSFQHMVADLYLIGQTATQIKDRLRPIVDAQQDTRCIFRGHGPDGFRPLPLHRQQQIMAKTVDKTIEHLHKLGIVPLGQEKAEDWDQGNRDQRDGEQDRQNEHKSETDGSEAEGSAESEGNGQERESQDDGEQAEGESSGGSESDGEEAGEGAEGAETDGDDGDEGRQEELPNMPPPQPSESSDWKWYVEEVKRIHAWCQERAETGEWVDEFGMRPLIDGARAFKQGVPGKGLLHAMTLHWPEETRREAGIKRWNPATLDSRKKEPPRDKDGNLIHPLARYMYRLALARIPIMLVGGKGGGKSHLARDLASLMSEIQGVEFPYGETPMTAGASPSWLIGGETMSGFKTRPFLEIYRDGGVFCFEEVDAADPNMTIVLNNALAADSFYNPANGQVYEKSKNFVCVATANTFGLGANRDYTGRERLDGAFLDRFRMGRIEINLDWDLGTTIAAGILDG